MTDHIPENSTRESDNFLHLPTGYQKIIITNNWDDVGNIDGIPVIHIIDFLTKYKENRLTFKVSRFF